MTVSTSVPCPHCSADNAAGAQFCEACGMALPSAAPTGPRVLDGKAFASTAAGQRLQSEDLHAQQKKAAGALMAVAVIQTLVVGFLCFVANQNHRLDVLLRSPIVLAIMAVAAIFWGLFAWARWQPLPAAVVGLVLYATLLAINVVNSVSQLSHNNGRTPTGLGGLGIGWIDIVILAVLSRAISAGIKYRKMMQGDVA
jgi:hypothetical protein